MQTPDNNRRTMPHGIQTLLANLAGTTPQLINDYLHGRKNASAPVADRLAKITDSDIRIWMLGGDCQARHKAIVCWVEREVAQEPTWNLYTQQPLLYLRPLPEDCGFEKDFVEVIAAAVSPTPRGLLIMWSASAMGDRHPSGHTTIPISGEPFFTGDEWRIWENMGNSSIRLHRFALPDRETLQWWEAHKNRIRSLDELHAIARREYPARCYYS